MRPTACLLIVLLCSFWSSYASRAQQTADTLITWKGYAQTGICRVRVFHRMDEKTRRDFAVVIDELAENEGPSSVSDARYLVEIVGRSFGIDPVRAYWIFHWGAFSYAGADPGQKKELFLRATFRHTTGERLSSPAWRMIDREDVDEITDRMYR